MDQGPRLSSLAGAHQGLVQDDHAPQRSSWQGEGALSLRHAPQVRQIRTSSEVCSEVAGGFPSRKEPFFGSPEGDMVLFVVMCCSRNSIRGQLDQAALLPLQRELVQPFPSGGAGDTKALHLVHAKLFHAVKLGLGLDTLRHRVESQRLGQGQNGLHDSNRVAVREHVVIDILPALKDGVLRRFLDKERLCHKPVLVT